MDLIESKFVNHYSHLLFLLLTTKDTICKHYDKRINSSKRIFRSTWNKLNSKRISMPSMKPRLRLSLSSTNDFWASLTVSLKITRRMIAVLCQFHNDQRGNQISLDKLMRYFNRNVWLLKVKEKPQPAILS